MILERRDWLLWAVSSVIWRIPGRVPSKLAGFSHTEAGSAFDMLAAVEETPRRDMRARYFRHALDEMKHADVLAERILFLNGLPNFQAIHKLKVGETVEEILKADLAIEQEAIPLLMEAADYCQQVKDFTSGQLFENILASEEEHVDFLETQFDMIERMGLQNYVQLQSRPAGEGES